MEIFIDDQPYRIKGPHDQTVGELADEIYNTGEEGDRRMVVGLYCNGQPVTNDQLETVLQTPANQFDQLELQTQPVAALVRATISKAIELFEESATTRFRTADLLAEGQIQEAMNQLHKFFEAWKQVQDSVMVTAKALQLNLDTHKANNLTLTEILGLIKDQLNELKGALENGDHVVVGDILRYEFDEPFEYWIAFMKTMRDQADNADI